MTKHSLIGGAIILTIASFITRILGFIYRIYMSRLIGAEGMGLFQLIFPIYMLGYTLSSSGISVAVSKLVAEENAKRNPANARKILRLSLLVAVGIAWIFMMIVLLKAQQISTYILKDTRTTLALGILGLSVPFMAAASMLKGYFYGLQEMDKPAVAQVFEQLMRMITIYLIADWFIPKGITYACAMAAIGMTVGEFISFSYTYICYKQYQKKQDSFKQKFSSLTTKKGLYAILAIAMPITLNRGFSSILQSIETIMLPTRLQLFGYSYAEAIGLYGQFSGMAMPLIFFPSILTTSLAMTLIPTISEAKAIKNTRQIQYSTSKSLQIASLIGMGTACLFILFSHSLGKLIYRQKEVGTILYSLSWLCPFLYFQQTLSGVLNGLGEQIASFRHTISGALLRMTMIYFIVPLLGLQGLIWSLLVSTIWVTGLHLKRVLQKTHLTFDLSNWILKPILASIGAAFITQPIQKHFIMLHFPFEFSIILSIAFLGIIYLLMIIALGCFSKEDINKIRKNL